MPLAAGGTARLTLPGRIRTKQLSGDAQACRLALADRIAGLTGIAMQDDPDGSAPHAVCVVLAAPGAPASGRPDLLCRVSRDGLEVYGLSDRGRHQVLRSGWGSLQRDHVLLHLPRDAQELEICWQIIEHAFFQSAMSVAVPQGSRKASPWDLPRFSRTSLQ